MTEDRQQPQISSLETSDRHGEEEFDLENPVRTTNDDDDDDASEHYDEQYTDEDDTTYTKRSSAYRWISAAIVVLTIIIIFLSRGSFEGVDAKNQDVEKEGAVLGEPRGKTSLGGGNTEDVVKAQKEAEQKDDKSQKSKKSKKSKADKW